MSDLNTKRRSILQYEPRELLDFVLALRTSRRNSIITAAASKAARQKQPKDKQKVLPKQVSALIGSLSADQAEALLQQLRSNRGE